MDEKIRQKLAAYKRKRTEIFATAVSNWQRGGGITLF
jgi:hypothetical protein